MTVACYVHVNARQNDDTQQADVQRWLDANGIDANQVKWYSDKDTGKTLITRPEFDRLQVDIFQGKIHSIVVWKLDRLSRRLKDGVMILAGWADRGLKIVVVTPQLEFNGNLGRTLAVLLLGLAEIEAEYRKERQAVGIKVAKRNGAYQGRKRGTMKATPQRAIELKNKGLTAAEIATSLGVSARTVFRYFGIEKESVGMPAQSAQASSRKATATQE